jgi:hypothetical protein
MVKGRQFWLWCAVVFGGIVAYVCLIPGALDFGGQRNLRKRIRTCECLANLLNDALYFEQQHGRFPEDASALRRSLTEALGQDRSANCYDKRGCAVDGWGRPLRWKIDPDGKRIMIYSVGANGIDEGGHNGRRTDGQFNDDLAVTSTIPRNAR